MIDAEYEELDADDGELDLADTDNLPWLESDADEEDAGGLDMMQLVGFVALLLALLGAVVGAVWYVSHSTATGDVVADGSVIPAPEGPIKERPEDPGGKTFAGTGNLAPVVGEGGKPDAVVAEPDAAPATKPVPVASASPAAAPAADTAGVGVQLAAYSSRSRAEQGWTDLTRRTATLNGVKHRVVEGKVDIGTVYRLQAIAATRAEAEALCTALKSDGLDCQVK
ncbi:MAG: SPOR domain-containing protein [Porphyrobacter sp.]|nr:SPOR domain-containing protein [Porphyrobacter sp.]